MCPFSSIKKRSVEDFLKSGWLLSAARMSSAFMPRVSTPLSSKTRLIQFGMPTAKFIDWGFPPYHPSRIIVCLSLGFTLVLDASRSSLGIAAWQLLWSKIHTICHPSSLGYFCFGNLCCFLELSHKKNDVHMIILVEVMNANIVWKYVCGCTTASLRKVQYTSLAPPYYNYYLVYFMILG